MCIYIYRLHNLCVWQLKNAASLSISLPVAYHTLQLHTCYIIHASL